MPPALEQARRRVADRPLVVDDDDEPRGRSGLRLIGRRLLNPGPLRSQRDDDLKAEALSWFRAQRQRAAEQIGEAPDDRKAEAEALARSRSGLPSW
jgi:hypothetical protein